jgi:hypothetical protein
MNEQATKCVVERHARDVIAATWSTSMLKKTKIISVKFSSKVQGTRIRVQGVNFEVTRKLQKEAKSQARDTMLT